MHKHAHTHIPCHPTFTLAAMPEPLHAMVPPWLPLWLAFSISSCYFSITADLLSHPSRHNRNMAYSYQGGEEKAAESPLRRAGCQSTFALNMHSLTPHSHSHPSNPSPLPHRPPNPSDLNLKSCTPFHLFLSSPFPYIIYTKLLHACIAIIYYRQYTKVLSKVRTLVYLPGQSCWPLVMRLKNPFNGLPKAQMKGLGLGVQIPGPCKLQACNFKGHHLDPEGVSLCWVKSCVWNMKGELMSVWFWQVTHRSLVVDL